jgi:hypothetical protein
MAVAPVRTFGLLNHWPDVVHANPWQFNQINGEGVRVAASCQNQVYIQYERDYIARALHDAAVRMSHYLGFHPMPTWYEDVIVTVNSDLAWDGQTLEAPHGYLQAFGRRATLVIESDILIEYSDEDGDQTDDTATVEVTGVTNIVVDEIQVFVRVEDGAKTAAHEYWQIEPVTIEKSGDMATITIPRYLLAHPKSVWGMPYTEEGSKHAGDTTDADDFLAYVDVYRVYADATSAVQLIGSESAVTNATADVTDSYMGYFRIRTGDGQSAPSCQPRQVRVFYKAGLPLMDGLPDGELELAIVRYANTLMPQQPAFCDRTIAMWEDDRKVVSENISAYDAWYPPVFGINEAALYAASVVGARRNALKGKQVTKR